MKQFEETPERVISSTEARHLSSSAKKFESVFESQLRELEIYFVSQKAPLDTSILIDRGEEIIPEELRRHISDAAQKELHQAGRCVAFNLPSAAGFHLVRALEDVVRDYYNAVRGSHPRPSTPSIGGYVKALGDIPKTKKITASLEQIKNLHRNQLVHKGTLTMSQAIILLGIIQSVIMAMAEVIKRKTLEKTSKAR